MQERAKVVMLGASHVGKTSIVTRYIQNGFSEEAQSTIGASFVNKSVTLDDGHEVHLQIWDTAGQEQFRSLAPMYYHSADAAIIVFALNNVPSFEGVREWIDELSEACEIRPALFIVGNKADLEGKTISEEQISELSNEIHAQHVLTSAKTGIGIDELFWEVAAACRNRGNSVSYGPDNHDVESERKCGC